MLCLTQCEDDVTRFLVGKLVSFASEDNPIALPCASRDVEFQNVLSFGDLFPFAFLAALLVLEKLAGPRTSCTGDSLLCDKTRPNLTEDLFRAYEM